MSSAQPSALGLDVTTAAVVTAVDENFARAGCAHLAEGDLLGVGFWL